jgi:hypothetical protein
VGRGRRQRVAVSAIPNPPNLKQIRNPKRETQNVERGTFETLEFGALNLFEIWDLEFDI